MTAVVNPSIGVVAPYDFALDRELWRWVPDTLDLLLTRTPYEPLTVSVEMATRVHRLETTAHVRADLLSAVKEVLLVPDKPAHGCNRHINR